MLDIRFQDAHLMVIYKPRGVVVHEGVGVKSGTLQDDLATFYRVMKIPTDKLDRMGLVHRLDKNTAGLMVVAKTPQCQEKLNALIKEHKIKRTYNGLVEGVLHGNGTIDKNLDRAKSDRTTYMVVPKPNGRTAITHYTVLQNYARGTLVKFELETGRTHQIRVHCKSIGKPLVGDPEYNPNGKISNGIGQMLESVEIQFTHPITGQDIHISAPTSEIFQENIKKLGQKS